jgi:hypothetical protein
MDYLGLLCLGAFVGTIATFGLRRVTSIQDWQTVLGFTLPAVLSGAAVVFVDRFKYSPAFGCYPLGLVVALMWAYVQVAVDDIKNGPAALRVLGVLHLAAATLVTVSAAFVATVPAYLQLRAEWETTISDRVQDLIEERNRTRQEPANAKPASRKGATSDAASAPAGK